MRLPAWAVDGRAVWGKQRAHRNSSPGCDDIDAGAAIGKGILAPTSLDPSKLREGAGRGILDLKSGSTSPRLKSMANIDPTVE